MRFTSGFAAIVLGVLASEIAHARSDLGAYQQEQSGALSSGQSVKLKKDDGPVRIAAVETAENQHEITFSGRRFTSRDQVEGYLLYRAALFAKQSGHRWFILLHMPGEGGPEAHPPRRSPTFGQAYGHWQPHWSYYRPVFGWQPWRPEWGVRFWADDMDLRDVERFEVHAMIELGRGAVPRDPQMAFDAEAVLKDLQPLARVLR